MRTATRTARPGPRWDFRCRDGTPAVGWVPAGRGRRLLAWLADLVLILATAGLGWLLWARRTWPVGRTPGQSMLGLTVFGTDTRRPADRGRMLSRALVYQPLVLVLGLVSLGLAWVYCAVPALGPARRTIADEWSRTVLLSGPPGVG